MVDLMYIVLKILKSSDMKHFGHKRLCYKNLEYSKVVKRALFK